MPSNKPYQFDTTGLSQLQRDLHATYMRNELLGGKGAYNLSHAGRGRSGYSFGPAQWDLANNKDARKKFNTILDKYAEDNSGKINILVLDKIKKAVANREESPIIESNKAVIGKILAGDHGRNMIDKHYLALLKEREGAVNKIVEAGQKNPNARDFLNSRQGQALIGDYINQYPDYNKLKKFVSGETIEFNGKKHPLNKPLDLNGWMDYAGRTKYATQNRDDFLRRTGNIADVVGKREAFETEQERFILNNASPSSKSTPDQRSEAQPGDKKPDQHSQAEPVRTSTGDFLVENFKNNKGGDNPLPEGTYQEASLVPVTPPKGSAKTKDAAGDDNLENTAESRKLLAELTKVDHPAEDILYKKPETWTEDEMKQVKKFRFSLTPSDPRFEDIAQRENDWFRHVYTDNPAKPDATGRINEPQPVNPIPKKAAPVKDADGIDFMSGLKRINKRIAHAAKMSGGTSPAVKSFQRGLNMTAQAGADAKDTPSFHTLKEDGVLGAKTRNAVKRTMADQGTAHAENALALGQLHDYAQNNDKRGFADLAKTTKSAFGPLFHDPAKPLAEKAPRYESVALQETVNDMGKQQFGADKWQPLKTDGWIGPKTTNAFSQVSKAVDPHSLTKRLESFLGFA